MIVTTKSFMKTSSVLRVISFGALLGLTVATPILLDRIPDVFRDAELASQGWIGSSENNRNRQGSAENVVFDRAGDCHRHGLCSGPEFARFIGLA